MIGKIAMCGCMEGGLDVIDYLISHGIKITYFISLNPEQAKKYNVSGYVSYERLAAKHKIPIYFPKTYSLKDDEDLGFFQKNNFDLLILVGWQRLIPEQVLNTLRIGGLGIHGSSEYLPKGRGRSPVNWSLIEGKKRYILHIFLLTPGVDDGDILDQQIFDINDWDTCRTINYKIFIVQKRMLKDLIPKLFENKFQRIPQRGEPTYYPKRNPEDGKIDWNKQVFEIYNFIRALTRPYPGAFSYINGTRINIWKAQPFDTRITYINAKNGEIVEKFSTGDFVVQCKSGTLLVTDYEGDVHVSQIFTS